MPRPRYLKRATESADIELEDGEWPAAHADDIEAFQAAVAIWKDDWTRKLGYARASPMSEDKKRKAKERSQQKRADRDRMLLETQVSLGIKEDPAAEASQGPVSHPVFICFDIEAIERPPNPVSEVGIAIFDSRVANNKAVPRGTCGRGWWPSIQAHHLRVKEYSGLVNHDFVKGCPGAFDFG